MKINLMRVLDYWVGVPVCFLLSFWNLIIRLFHFKKKTSSPKKILLIKLSELGAIILAYPLLRRLKSENPDTSLFFVTFKKNQGIFKLLNGIVPENNVLLIRDNSLIAFSFDTLKVLNRIWQERIDIVFDLEFFSRFSAIVTYITKANKKIGFYRYTFEGLYRGNLLTHKIQYNPLSHATKTFLSLAGVIKEKSKSSPEMKEGIHEEDIIFPKYQPDHKVTERIKLRLKNVLINSGHRIFLLNAGEGVLPLREWPQENFIKLSSRILDDADNYIVMVGTEGASSKAAAVLKTLDNPRCLDMTGKTSLEELMELFCLSRALISNDCGLSHLAMLTPIKKFIIFGPESPQIFSPQGENNWIFYSHWPCSPCLSVFNHRDSKCKDNLCLKVIEVDEVYELIKKHGY